MEAFVFPELNRTYWKRRMLHIEKMLRLALILALVGISSGDLTGRLVDDADNMANIVGAKETLDLVDYKLHQEQGKRETLASVAKDAKDVAGKRYREMQEAEAADAKITNELRHLKSRLAIDKDSATAKEAVAAKAEAVAKRMELLAQQTAHDAAAALHQQQHDEQQLTVTQSAAERSARKRKEAERARREAEAKARASAAALAEADTGVQSLLRRHSKLEKMQLEEETRQTTRLADAFKEDARRQEEFKESLAAAKAREHAQRSRVPSRAPSRVPSRCTSHAPSHAPSRAPSRAPSFVPSRDLGRR